MLFLLKATVLSVVREKSVFIWALAFPVVLATIFIGMFSGFDALEQFRSVPVAVVQDESYKDADGFKEAIARLSEDGPDQMLEVTYVSSAERAREMILGTATAEEGGTSVLSPGEKEPCYGYFQVNDNGDPVLYVKGLSASSATSAEKIYQSVLEVVGNDYVQKEKLIENIGDDDPLLLTKNGEVDEAKIGKATERNNLAKEIQVTYNQPRQSVRFYYALLAMAALFAAQPGILCICRMQPNLSELGRRRSMSATSRWRSLIASILASWLVSFGCLLIVFLYILLVARVDFGARALPCVGVLAASSLLATALGALLGAVPKLSLGGKVGILSVLACASSFFAGLYGEPTMKLADEISAAAPIVDYLNPASLIAQSFYSINYYDTFSRAGEYVGVILLMALAAFAVAGVMMGRQRYASL